jgi:hypothetical protein
VLKTLIDVGTGLVVPMVRGMSFSSKDKKLEIKT